MLMVTTTVNVINRIHSHTTSSGPRISLDAVFVEGTPGLQDRFIDTSASSDDTDHSSRSAGNNLLCARRELQSGLSLIGIMSNDDDIVSRCASQGTAVADLLLDVGYDGSLGHGAQGEDVADGQVSLLAGVDELASVHSLVGDEGFCAEFVAVRITEGDFGERRTSAGVVENLLDDATEVAVSLSVLPSSASSIYKRWDGEIHRGLGIWQHPFGDGCATGKYLQIFCIVSLCVVEWSGVVGTSVRG